MPDLNPDEFDFGPNGPTPGTAAHTAFVMARLFPPDEHGLPDDYWDTFKDELNDSRDCPPLT